MPHPLDEQWIRDAEIQLGAKLPASYCASMKASNGGMVIIDEDDWHLFPIRDGSTRKRLAGTIHDLFYETECLRERQNFPADALAIASDGGGNALVFRLQGGDVPADVYDWDHETGELVWVADFADIAPRPQPTVRRSRKPRLEAVSSIRLAGGVALSPIPKPWHGTSLKSPFELSFGKRWTFRVSLVEGPAPPGEADTDEDWIAAWTSSLDFHLDPAECEVTRTPLDDPPGVLVTVRSPRWVPVRLWWCPASRGRWHAVARTELAREAGDRRELLQLVRLVRRS